MSGKAQFIECAATVPPDCYAVTDGETWGIYPQRYCRGATIIRCSKCGKPATHVDPYFPYFTELNLCDEHHRAAEDPPLPFARKAEQVKE